MKSKIYLLAFLTLTLTFSCISNPKSNKETEIEKTATEMTKKTTAAPDGAHNSRNSVDYNGTYDGVIPCADCEGIKTSITLHTDGTFSRTIQYLGKEDKGTTENGDFTWNDEGSAISISTSPNETQLYKVGENVLFHLDKEGNRIEGDLAENYKLQKATKSYEDIENKTWVLVELLGKKLEAKENAPEAFILLNGEQSRISGNNSCNTFNGSYELKGNGQISIGTLAVTQRACMDMTIGASFNDVLSKVDNYTINDGILNLNKAKMATLAKFELQ